MTMNPNRGDANEAQAAQAVREFMASASPETVRQLTECKEALPDLSDDEVDVLIGNVAPSGDVRDENGMTVHDREDWRAHYFAIERLAQCAITGAPTYAEAKRRIGLLRLTVRMLESAADAIGEHGWSSSK